MSVRSGRPLIFFSLGAMYALLAFAAEALFTKDAFAFIRATNAVSWHAWDGSVARGYALIATIVLFVSACKYLSRSLWQHAQRATD